jgi:hypothetical protein
MTGLFERLMEKFQKDKTKYMINTIKFLYLIIILNFSSVQSSAQCSEICWCFEDSIYEESIKNRLQVVSLSDTTDIDKKYNSLDLGLLSSKDISIFMRGVSTIKYLSIENGTYVDSKNLQSLENSLIYFNGSALKWDNHLNLPNLSIFITSPFFFMKFPEFIFKSKKLKKITIGVKKLEESNIGYFPNSLQCITLFVQKYRIKNIPLRFFELPNLINLTLGVNNLEKKKLPVLPNGIPTNTSIKSLEIPIDLSDPINIKELVKITNLECLGVEKYTGNDFTLLEKLTFVKEIRIRYISDEKKSQIHSLYKNVKIFN